MAISSIGIGSSAIDTGIATSPSVTATSDSGDIASTATASSPDAGTGGVNNSALSQAIRQALAQVNAGGDLSGLLTATGQQSTSDFMSSLFNALQTSPADASQSNPFSGLPGYGPSQAATAPVALNQSSPTIGLQKSIQSLINQLGDNSNIGSLFGGDSGSGGSPALLNLQQSFNSLLTNSGGNPSQASLQSFLKTVAANIQGSTSLGSFLDVSA
ncbi:MAG TPA: hypothetical protein VF450_25020 [Noviherbaspirillum sp.]